MIRMFGEKDKSRKKLKRGHNDDYTHFLSFSFTSQKNRFKLPASLKMTSPLDLRRAFSSFCTSNRGLCCCLCSGILRFCLANELESRQKAGFGRTLEMKG